MEVLFQAVNAICGKIQIISNLFWDFPTNFEWYGKIPILGNFSLAIILLVGTGIYFTFRLRFIQVRKFRYGLHVLMRQKSSGTGISSLTSFLLSTAMRVGPGNILGVTGAISTGGPGALSGCGSPRFSEWQQPSWRRRSPRYLRKEKMTSMWADCRFTEEDF